MTAVINHDISASATQPIMYSTLNNTCNLWDETEHLTE